MPPTSPPRLLSIATSDSGGGAGIQADLKAFARCGAHGMTAIAALTAQSTVAVDEVITLPAGAILAQVRSVASDIGVDAVKVGMLGTVQAIEETEEALKLLDGVPVVVDPVMVAESGARLLPEEAIGALIDRILPRATVITPNIPEARALAAAGGVELSIATEPGGVVDDARGGGPAGDDPVEVLAAALRDLGPSTVVVTGGHRDEVVDVFADADGIERITGERYQAGAAHGSGCTHSSALAALLARGRSPLDAARGARIVAGEAVRDGLRGVGAGQGPVDALAVLTREVPLA